MELYKKVRPDPKALQFQVDRFMEAFDQRTEMVSIVPAFETQLKCT